MPASSFAGAIEPSLDGLFDHGTVGASGTGVVAWSATAHRTREIKP